MYRVELKGVRKKKFIKSVSFLMHRVELKGSFFLRFFSSASPFLMHRVELKAQTEG